MKITLYVDDYDTGVIVRLLNAGFQDFQISATPAPELPVPAAAPVKDEPVQSLKSKPRKNGLTMAAAMRSYLKSHGPSTFGEIKAAFATSRWKPNATGATISKLAKRGLVERQEGRKWALKTDSFEPEGSEG